MPQRAGATASPTTPRPLAPTKNHHSHRTSETTSSRTNDSSQERLHDIGEAPKKSGFFGSWFPSLFGSSSKDRQDHLSEGQDIHVEDEIDLEQGIDSSENDLVKEFSERIKEKEAVEKTPLENNDWWQRTTAIGGTFALATRKTKGIMSTCLILSLLILANNRDTSTKDRVNGIVRNREKAIHDQIAQTSILEQGPGVLELMRKEGNDLFKGLIEEELENEACQSKLAMALHDDLVDWKQNYEALVNQTKATLKEQDGILGEIDSNTVDTFNETKEELNLMLEDIQDIRSALEAGREAALLKYTILYDQAQYNQQVAQETLDRVQAKIDGALKRMETTRRRIDNQAGKGPVRKKILGKARDALNAVKASLQEIGNTEFQFTALDTPAKYKEETLDPAFEEQNELLIGLEDTANLIMENCENGIATHEALSAAHRESTKEWEDFQAKQTTRDDLLKRTESLWEVYLTQANATATYINGTEGDPIDPNATLAEIDAAKNNATESVSKLFNETLLSDDAEDKFDGWDTFLNWTYGTLQVIGGIAAAYTAGTTLIRGVNEWKDMPYKCPELLNERFDFDDFAGVRIAKVEAGMKTDIKVRGMRCEAVGTTAGTALFGKKNRVYNIMFLIWAGMLIKDKYFESTYAEIDQKTTERMHGINTTLTETRESYIHTMTDACVAEYDKKLSVSGLNGAIAEEIQSASERDPEFNATVTYLRNHQDPECQDPTLNEALRFQDMTAAEILEHCEDFAEDYVDGYFQENFDQTEYEAELEELMETLKGEESAYRSKKAFNHWSMGALSGFVALSAAILHAHQYKNPDKIKEHEMNSKEFGWFKGKAKRPIPGTIALIKHTLDHHDVELDKQPLLPITEGHNHLAGHYPEKDGTAHLASTTGKKVEGSASKTDKKRIKEVRGLMSEDTKGMSDREIEYIMKENVAIFSKLGKTKGTGLLDKAKAIFLRHKQETGEGVEAVEEVEVTYRNPKKSITYAEYPDNV